MKASLGLNLRQGNSEQAEATTRVILIRRTAKNRVNLEYLASFSQIEGITTADSQRLTSGWNRYVSKRVFWTPFFGEWFRDPFQNIGARWSVGAGFGYELIDTSRIDWKAEAGLADAADEVEVDAPRARRAFLLEAAKSSGNVDQK